MSLMGTAAASIGDFDKLAAPSPLPIATSLALVSTPYWLPSLREVSSAAADIAPIIGVIIGIVTLYKTLTRHPARNTQGVFTSLRQNAVAGITRGGPIAIVAVVVLAIASAAMYFVKPRRDAAPLGIMSATMTAPRRKSKDDAGDDGDAGPMKIDGAPPWFNRLHALVGEKEGTAKKPNPKIAALFEAAGFGKYKDQSAIAWCSIGLCGAMELENVVSARSTMARAWLKWGVPLKKPRIGAVMVFKRGRDPTYGHVGEYAGETKTHYKILGCNQSDAVKISLFPKTALLPNGIRWPKAHNEKKVEKAAVATAVTAGGGVLATAVSKVEETKESVAPIKDNLETLGTPWALKLAAYIGIALAVVSIGTAVYAFWYAKPRPVKVK